MAPMGRLMKNSHRHEAWSTSQPPSTGPSSTVSEVKDDHSPMARGRSSSSNEAETMASDSGTSSAAAAPCRARAAIRVPIDGASAQPSEVSEKSATPIMNRRRRP